jgi:hypothetical protein
MWIFKFANFDAEAETLSHLLSTVFLALAHGDTMEAGARLSDLASGFDLLKQTFKISSTSTSRHSHYSCIYGTLTCDKEAKVALYESFTDGSGIRLEVSKVRRDQEKTIVRRESVQSGYEVLWRRPRGMYSSAYIPVYKF